MPPKSFYPVGLRQNLWTVPSCDSHNLDLSTDVEYVRSVLAMGIGTNDLARALVAGKVRRSWSRRPSLLQRTFAKVRPVLFGSVQTAVVTLEMDRFDRILGLIATALYFRDTGRTWPHGWMVYGATLLSEEVAMGAFDPNDKLMALLGAMAFENQLVPEPRVFQAACATDAKGQRMYRLLFYEGAAVYAVPLPPEPPPPN